MSKGIHGMFEAAIRDGGRWLGFAMLLGTVGVGSVEATTWARATGGNATNEYTDVQGFQWRAHIFTNVGTFAEGLQITTPGMIEYLIVGGGGGGGARKTDTTSGGGAGGGGAGGVLSGTFLAEALTYSVTVGALSGDTITWVPLENDADRVEGTNTWQGTGLGTMQFFRIVATPDEDTP